MASASAGLLLWYKMVLPALLPFSILSNILIYSNYMQSITKYPARLLQPLLPISENGVFVLFTGFLFGFPMGSKNCAQLLQKKSLSQQEAQILFVITNNISPVFISSYILQQQLKLPSLTLLSYLVLFLPPLLWGEYLLTRSKSKYFSKKNPASGSQMNFKIIDAGIMNGFETIIKLGGYIMLFSMAASFLRMLPIPKVLLLIITGFTEITTGIQQLGQSNLSIRLQYILAMTFTAFGGISGLAQTSSMVKGTVLSMKKYLLQKLFLTGVSALLAYGVAILCHL